MGYYCGSCGTKLVSKKIKTGDRPTGTTGRIHYKVLTVITVRHYKCPNDCELKRVHSEAELRDVVII